MRINRLLVLATLAGSAGTALAAPRESVTFTAVDSVNSLNDAANITTIATFTGGYRVGKIRISGDLTSAIAGTFASEARIRVTAPGGATFTIQPFTTGDFSGTINVTDAVTTLASPINEAAGAWSFQFYESFNDGTGPDATWDNISITLDDEVPAPPPPAGSIDLGSIALGANRTETSTIAAGEIRWYRLDIPAPLTAAARTYLDLDTLGSSVGDTEIALYSTTGAKVVEDDDGAGTLKSLLSFGYGSRVPDANIGQDGNLAAGTYYLAVAEFNAAFASDFNATSSGANGGDLTLNIASGTYVPPPPPPPPESEDLGTINQAATGRQSVPHTEGQIHWYKFTLPGTISAASSKFLDIDTLGTTLTPWDLDGLFIDDTELGLYGADGLLLSTNDDGGDGFTSYISFGTGAGGNGIGQDGSAINAGTYYLAIGGFNTTYGLSRFNVTSTNTTTGTIQFAITTNAIGCAADFNADGFVDFFDFDDFVLAFESGTQGADFNNDGFVDFFDFDDYVVAFETGC
jgi:hypothetical protein